MGNVKMWLETVEIPTYAVGKEDINPMFLEKRVYQGSSGKVYPYPVIDKIYNEKVMKPYKIVVLENAYLRVEIMPEIGGRIYRALDKTNNYDFVYHNHVIKPALVGLAGPWISGGIEFNWPQHHRPNTFGKVEYILDDSLPHKKTLYVGEIDRMYGTKVTTGISLYEDKSYIEIDVRLYNPTPEYQTFLWWANPAIAVHDNTQSIFPPDVNAVFDHGKRDVSKFPIATGTYYKIDYSKGIDISRYTNIPVPTSYMAYHSDYDFVGSFDYIQNAGILHIADHHISPGKKQWTWGCGDFGKAWDRNLTDADGPYVELMTGVYTDNQPDFSYLMPHEEKRFTQYFMPYKGVGAVKNATKDIVAGLDFDGSRVRVRAYATSPFENVTVRLEKNHIKIFEETITLDPTMSYEKSVDADASIPSDLTLTLLNAGDTLLTYSPPQPSILKTPDPAKRMKNPEDIKTTEELLLAGMHLEQYRHATYDPAWYYSEGLKREPGNIRLNNAIGNLLLKQGDWTQAAECFKRAVKTLTTYNGNPYDSESFYNLGHALHYGGMLNEAYEAYYKSTWSAPYQAPAYFGLGQIASAWGEYEKSAAFLEKALYFNGGNYRAKALQAVLWRKLGLPDRGVTLLERCIKDDPLDMPVRFELALAYKASGEVRKSAEAFDHFSSIAAENPLVYLHCARFYMDAGLYGEGADVIVSYPQALTPLMLYHLAFCRHSMGRGADALAGLAEAEAAGSRYCFPNTLWDLKVLQWAVETKPDAGKAYYYMGNILYDKKQHAEAIGMWEKSLELCGSFPTVHRNLALGYYNKLGDKKRARLCLEKAFELDPTDARVFYELDQLYKKISLSLEARLDKMLAYFNCVEERDDLYIEYLTVLNMLGRHQEVIDKILARRFHPWEGGEGKVPSQYITARLELAKLSLKKADFDTALSHLNEARIYPENIGEGKLVFAYENHIDYYTGLLYELKKEWETAKHYYSEATKGDMKPTGAMFYNDQPPEIIYYKGMAFMKLSNMDAANAEFYKLIDYGEKNIFTRQRIDYFAVSLPDFLVFEEDLDLKNTVHCYFMMGLGYLGLNNNTLATRYFDEAQKLQPFHQQLSIHRALCH